MTDDSKIRLSNDVGHRDRRLSAQPPQDSLRKLTVVKPDVAKDSLFEILAAAEAVALQDVLDPAVNASNHGIIRPDWIGASILSVTCGADVMQILLADGQRLRPSLSEKSASLLKRLKASALACPLH